MRSAASGAKLRKLGRCLCACDLVKLGQIMVRKRRGWVRAKRGIRSEAEEIGRMPLRMQSGKIGTDDDKIIGDHLEMAVSI